MTQRRWGRSRTVKFLTRTMIPERKPLETLTERQRRMLADALKEAQ